MLLAIETATSACSVALFDGDRLVAATHEEVGRGHAERLIMMIAALPGGGRADAISVGCGPGSFTGVRVGIAAARALALGWGAPVHGYPTFALIAAGANGAADQIGVAIDGGHGELFCATYSTSPLAELVPLAALSLDAAVAALPACIVGNAAARVVGQRGHGTVLAGDANAANVLRLPQRLQHLPPSPIYGRPPDARPMPAR
jgi:tRNA threonylcarbamoyladenosine biosynthesis protein TsaB